MPDCPELIRLYEVTAALRRRVLALRSGFTDALMTLAKDLSKDMGGGDGGGGILSYVPKSYRGGACRQAKELGGEQRRDP